MQTAGHERADGPARAGRAGVALLALLVAGSFADAWTGWFTRLFDAVAHQFYEIALLAALRRPSQLALARGHVLALGIVAALGLLLWSRLDRHRRWWWAAFLAAYAIRAAVWIAGGNLPLVPGDGSHYVEVASSVYRGEGPVKHYVESFFIPYPAIREGRGTLDDWATPLYAYVLAFAYRLAGVVPGDSLEATFAVAKGTSFILNLLCLPVLSGLARRVYGREIGLAAMGLLAVLPVHAIYAGFELRESLVALTSLLSVWAILEMWRARGGRALAWAVAAGAAGGLAILARNTAMALLAACAVYGVLVHWRTHRVAMSIWAAGIAVTIAPWAWMTYQAYGEPFFTYTGFFRYTFSWAVHHYQTGAPTAAQFLTLANAPEIVRVKLKSVLIIALYSTMILSVPVLAAAFARWRRGERDASARDMNRLSWLLPAAFVLATLINVADVTQVAQLGRYYLPVFCLILPAAAATMRSWSAHIPARARLVAAAALVSLLWSDPTWAYDATWLTSPFQLRLPALRAAGTWIREHPEAVPADARIMTWFPWELRVMSQRTTILMPRSFSARRNLETIGDGPFGYHVTHVLWGSFEPPPLPIDPQAFGSYLDAVRLQTGLGDDKQIYRSPPGVLFPVQLYQLRPPPR